MKNPAKLIVDSLQSDEHAILLYIVRQFAVSHTLFNAHKFTQDQNSSSSSGSASIDTFMMRAAPLTFVDVPSYHPKNPAKRLCVDANAVEFALHVKKEGLPLATDEKMVSDKQFEFACFAFSSYRNDISGVRGTERPKRVMGAATKSGKAGTARELRPEQKSNSLLRELVSRLSQPRNLVFDLLAGKFSTAAACCTVPCHRVLFGFQADPKYFFVARESVLRQFAKAALDAGTDDELSWELTEAAARVTFLLPEMAIADAL